MSVVAWRLENAILIPSLILDGSPLRFKKLFGEEPNKDLLIDFLNELLKQQGDNQIKDLTYANSKRLGNTNQDRKAVFDLYCENERGEEFIIELQKVRQQFFKERSLFYATFAIQEQAIRGQDWDFRLKDIYTIGIMDSSFDDSHPKQFQHTVKLVESTTQEIFYDKLTFIYLEMAKFNKIEGELVSHFDKWLYLLKNLRKFREIPATLQERVFRKAFQIAEVSNLNAEEMNAYETDLKYQRDWKNAMDFAIKEAVEKAVEKAIEETEEKAEQKAKKKVEQAKEETSRKKQPEIARNFKNAGVDVTIIAQSTGLKVAEINTL